MPFVLHPSGYCSYYSDFFADNLKRGQPCRYCRRVAGHATDCPDYKENTQVKSSRGKLYDSTSVLWYISKTKGTNFYTFTLPSRSRLGIYQDSPTCEHTGDIAIAQKFSKVLEAWSVRTKRQGRKLSYVWVAEAQMERQEKFGGCADIHFHLVTSELVKGKFGVTDLDTLQWLQSLWCEHVGATSNNCLHVDYITPDVNSMPAYMSKYMGKGSQRRIISRTYQASRDLSRFKPIKLNELPKVSLVNSKDMYFPNGYELTAYYYSTSEVLELYAEDMYFESSVTQSVSNKNFTPEAISKRKYLADLRKHYPQTDEFSRQVLIQA